MTTHAVALGAALWMCAAAWPESAAAQTTQSHIEILAAAAGHQLWDDGTRGRRFVLFANFVSCFFPEHQELVRSHNHAAPLTPLESPCFARTRRVATTSENT